MVILIVMIIIVILVVVIIILLKMTRNRSNTKSHHESGLGCRVEMIPKHEILTDCVCYSILGGSNIVYWGGNILAYCRDIMTLNPKPYGCKF